MTPNYYPFSVLLIYIYIIHVTCKTRTHLKSHHKWACRRLQATQLLVILPKVLHRKGLKCPRKLIRGPDTGCPALPQEQLIISSWHSCRQTIPPKGGPETTGVIDNVLKTKHAPPLCYFVGFFFLSRAGGKGEYRSSQSSLICRHPVYMMSNKTRSNPDRVVASLKNRKRTNKGYTTGILDHLCDTRSMPRWDPRPE
jgi:hypothetical protein